MRCKIAVWIGLCVFLISCTSFGQITTGTISGTVKDASGAVLPEASLLIQNEETGFSRTGATDAIGHYIAPSLDPGQYKITVTLNGFQTAVRNGIGLTLGREAVVNFDLAVGAVATTVEVTAEAPLVDTVGGTLGATIESSKIADLPLNGRDLAQLITLQTGVVNYNGDGDPGGRVLIVSGSRATTNVYYMDGVAIESYEQKTPTGQSGNFLGADGIREFKVDSNAYTAEYGRAGGGIFNIATKSGTNSFHGSIFEYIRNDNLDAAQWENNAFCGDNIKASAGTCKPEFKRNQFGFSFGGPIKKDKTFFFGNYEGLRARTGNTRVATTFSDAARAGNLAAGSVTISSVIRPYLDFWPRPNGAVKGDTGDYISQTTTPINEDYVQARLDHHFTDNDQAYVRYTFLNSSQSLPASLPNQATPKDTNTNQLVTIEEKHIFTPVLLNSLRLGFTRTNPINLNNFGAPTVDPSLRFVSIIPYLGGLTPGGGITGIGTAQSADSRKVNSLQLSDDLVYTKGRNTFKTGFMIDRVYFNGFQAARDAGQFTFGNLQSFLTNGNPSQFRGAISACCNDPFRTLQQNIIGLYFQDELRVTPRLTLTPGLRYEFITVPHEKYGRVGNIIGDLAFMWSANIASETLGNNWMSNPSLKNFAPRLGFAYDVFGDGKTAIRGGFGLFFQQYDQTWMRTTAWRFPPFLTEGQTSGSNQLQLPFPNIYEICSLQDPVNPTNLACSERPAPNFQPAHFKTPYDMQYNLNIQRQLTSSIVLTLGYAGSRGLDLATVADVNVQPAIQLNGRLVFPNSSTTNGRPNSNFDQMRYRAPSANSWYNAFQLSLAQRLKQGLQFTASYTFSKTMDQISGNQTASDVNTGPAETIFQNINLTKGLSAFDSPHVFTSSANYELPIGPGKAIGGGLHGVGGKALGGWETGGILTLRSGFPGTISMSNRYTNGVADEHLDLMPGFSTNPVSGTSAGCTFANGIPGPFTGAANSIAPGTSLGTAQLYFDPCAFAMSPNFGTSTNPLIAYGTLGRNTLRLPGLAQLDFTVKKDTRIGEGKKLEFRFEAYNFFNRVNLGNPGLSLFSTSGTLSASTAAQIKTSSVSRQIQLALRLTF